MTDVFSTFSDKDFRLGLNAAQTTLAAVAQLTGATLEEIDQDTDRSVMHDATGRVARRKLLQLAAASPLAAAGLWATPLGELLSVRRGRRQVQRIARDDAPIIAKAEDALDVFDFEAVARRTLPPAHFGYLATGTDGDETVRANREAFVRYQLRVRRLIDVAAPDMSVKLFGASYDSPIVLAPVGSQRAFHAEGEVAAAKGRARRSSCRSCRHIVDGRGSGERGAWRPVWFQLYPPTIGTSRRRSSPARKAGCTVLVLTVDSLGNNRLTQQAFMAASTTRTCECLPRDATHRTLLHHATDVQRHRPVQSRAPDPNDWSWEYVDRLCSFTRMKIVLKGIVAREDAVLARQHTGRRPHRLEPRRARRGQRPRRIESVREVVEGAGGAMPVLVDSGFRHGTDVFKALALGATAVCIGRPYIWGLAAFGQAGVEAVLGSFEPRARACDAPGRHAIDREDRFQLRHRSRALIRATDYTDNTVSSTLPPDIACNWGSRSFSSCVFVTLRAFYEAAGPVKLVGR